MDSLYREWLQAYADGINSAMADMNLHGVFEPWTAADTMAISRYITWEFSQGRTAGLERMATLTYLLERFDEETAKAMWRDLMSPTNPDAITTIPGDKKHIPLDVLAETAHLRMPPLSPEVSYSRERLGSNAIAVSQKRSATGNPLLMSNTQLEINFPAVYYEQHLMGGDFDVTGVTMPGFPPVGFGHNAMMAWTITVGCSDQQDIYEETVRIGPKNRPQYLFKGEWLDWQQRKEVVSVKGYAEPVTLTVYSTIHGPIETYDFDKGVAYTTRWGPYLDGDNLKAFFEMNRAKTMEEFAEALAKVEMSFNFLYTDIEGNIACWHAGQIPQRAQGHSGVMPISGTGEFEWLGFVPFKQMPRLINPETGIILLENNMPAPDSPAYDGSLTGWGTQRMERLCQLADGLPNKIRPADLEQILADKRYLIADRLKPELLRACRTQKDERLKDACMLLSRWDNTITAESAAATIFFVWLQKLGRTMLSDEFGEHCLPSLIEKPHLPLIIHVFEGEESKLPPSRDYFDDITTPNQETKDEIIIRSLGEALDFCEDHFGTKDMYAWSWDEFSYWPLGPLGKVPNLYMDPNRHHTDIIGGGASSQLMEASPGFPNAHNLVPPGNSGNPASPHAKDQMDLFVNFKYKPMVFGIDEVQKKAISKTELEIDWQ
jgi:penicillin amidase